MTQYAVRDQSIHYKKDDAGATNSGAKAAIGCKREPKFLLYCNFNISLSSKIDKTTSAAAKFDNADPTRWHKLMM